MSGDIVVAGAHDMPLTFGENELHLNGAKDAMLMVLNAGDGHVMVAGTYGGDDGVVRATGVSVLGETVALAGDFAGSLDFGTSGTLMAGSSYDAFLAWFE
jgi:hypothetical protein